MGIDLVPKLNVYMLEGIVIITAHVYRARICKSAKLSRLLYIQVAPSFISHLCMFSSERRERIVVYGGLKLQVAIYGFTSLDRRVTSARPQID